MALRGLRVCYPKLVVMTSRLLVITRAVILNYCRRSNAPRRRVVNFSNQLRRLIPVLSVALLTSGMFSYASASPVGASSTVTIKLFPVIGVAAVTQHLNPTSNVKPNPNFLQSGPCTKPGAAWICTNPCVTSGLKWPTLGSGPACTNYILLAINTARRSEGLGPMVLPTNWFSLTARQQLFVVADLERISRGLHPYLGINNALAANAQRAAQINSDPGVAKGFAVAKDAQGYLGMGGAWSGGFSVLAADYAWMYNDGWGGSAALTSNVVCTSAQAAGCWAHRDQLLGYDPRFNPGVGLGCANCEMGTGFAVVRGSGSFVDLVEIPKGVTPPMSFTWAHNVAPFEKH